MEVITLLWLSCWSFSSSVCYCAGMLKKHDLQHVSEANGIGRQITVGRCRLIDGYSAVGYVCIHPNWAQGLSQNRMCYQSCQSCCDRFLLCCKRPAQCSGHECKLSTMYNCCPEHVSHNCTRALKSKQVLYYQACPDLLTMQGKACVDAGRVHYARQSMC